MFATVCRLGLLSPDGAGIVIPGGLCVRTTVIAVHFGCKTFFLLTSPPVGLKSVLHIRFQLKDTEASSSAPWSVPCSAAAAEMLRRSEEICFLSPAFEGFQNTRTVLEQDCRLQIVCVIFRIKLACNRGRA